MKKILVIKGYGAEDAIINLANRYPDIAWLEFRFPVYKQLENKVKAIQEAVEMFDSILFCGDWHCDDNGIIAYSIAVAAGKEILTKDDYSITKNEESGDVA